MTKRVGGGVLSQQSLECEPTGAGRDSKVDSLAATKIKYDQGERSFSMNEIPSMA